MLPSSQASSSSSTPSAQDAAGGAPMTSGSMMTGGSPVVPPSPGLRIEPPEPVVPSLLPSGPTSPAVQAKAMTGRERAERRKNFVLISMAQLGARTTGPASEHR